MPLFQETLGKMHAPSGKFAVRGNFDSYFWKYIDLFSGTGFSELVNESIKIKKDGETFSLTGFRVPVSEEFSDSFAKVPC